MIEDEFHVISVPPEILRSVGRGRAPERLRDSDTPGIASSVRLSVRGSIYSFFVGCPSLRAFVTSISHG